MCDLKKRRTKIEVDIYTYLGKGNGDVSSTFRHRLLIVQYRCRGCVHGLLQRSDMVAATILHRTSRGLVMQSVLGKGMMGMNEIKDG